MTTQAASGKKRWRDLSLRWKLPIAASLVLIFVLGLYSWIGYREVAISTRIAAGQRNMSMVQELARVTGQSSGLRSRLVASTANHPAVRAALTSGQMAAVDTALEPLRVPIDSELTVILFNPKGEAVHFTGSPPDAETVSLAYPLFAAAARRDSLSVAGPLFNHRGRAHYWSVARIQSADQTVGFLAQFRAVRASEATVRTIRALLGDENRIVFSNRDTTSSSLATKLDGQILPSREKTITEDGYQRYVRGGVSYVAASDTIANSPWKLTVETPIAIAQARAGNFLKRTGALGLLLLISATAIVWLISRRYTRPIQDLNRAASAIARGDYEHRVQVDRQDELGALGNAFNQMANEIELSIAMAEASRAEAETANRSKSEFLANMSHEIRTPINAMLGYADLMEAGIAGPVTDQQKQHLEKIRVSGGHLTNLVNDLIDFARLETAQLSVSRQVAPALDAIGTAMTVVEPQAGAKSLTVSTHIEGEPKYVGDPQRVEQILVNLLGNAVKFTPAHGHVRLECRTFAANGGPRRTQFVVEDNGIGIPADRVESIFQPFVQAHTGYTRPHGGSGLGLTISRRLAEMMGGRLDAESEEGVGSKFTVTLPAPS